MTPEEEGLATTMTTLGAKETGTMIGTMTSTTALGTEGEGDHYHGSDEDRNHLCNLVNILSDHHHLSGHHHRLSNVLRVTMIIIFSNLVLRNLLGLMMTSKTRILKTTMTGMIIMTKTKTTTTIMTTTTMVCNLERFDRYLKSPMTVPRDHRLHLEILSLQQVCRKRAMPRCR